MSGDLLQQMIDRITETNPDVIKEALEEVNNHLKHTKWIPNPGAQTEAYFSEADILGFGGEAGPGKTDLIIGLAVERHTNSLVLRKTNKEAKKLSRRFIEVIGHSVGLNTSEGIWKYGDGVIDYGGCEHEDDKQKYKGDPHDLIAFDEVVDFSRSQVEFIMQWNRSTKKGQRCRVLMTFNPPTKTAGLWVIEYFAPWLDPKHPNPAKSGEIRWFTSVDGRDTEVDGKGPHLIDGEMIEAKSRSFIRGYLKENKALFDSGYDATRASAPKKLRAAYRAGDFEASLADFPGQLIPTAWVRAAQDRWTPSPPDNIPMCAIGVDASGGGDDPMVLAPRHDGYFPKLIEIPGEEIPIQRSGAFCAGVVVSYRRDDADIIVDMGGGYGGPLYEKLHENDIKVYAHKGAEKSIARTNEKKLGFFNKRSEVYWKFREALDPDQVYGSPIALDPDDPELFADLTTLSFEVTPQGIKVENKDDICARLGRSTNRGDAVTISYTQGAKQITHGELWRSGEMGRRKKRPVVQMGHTKQRRKRSA